MTCQLVTLLVAANSDQRCPVATALCLDVVFSRCDAMCDGCALCCSSSAQAERVGPWLAVSKLLGMQVVHIDLGVAFEQGRFLNTPELVPFRLTRDVVDGMGAMGVWPSPD